MEWARKKKHQFPLNSTLPEVSKTAHVWNVKKSLLLNRHLEKKIGWVCFGPFGCWHPHAGPFSFVACICKRPRRKRTWLLGQLRADCWVLRSITKSITWPNMLSGNFGKEDKGLKKKRSTLFPQLFFFPSAHTFERLYDNLLRCILFACYQKWCGHSPNLLQPVHFHLLSVAHWQIHAMCEKCHPSTRLKN